ncbi:MAG TPA: non-heme iron oxygenase ferredoxin subunit [archaeon]|nr:non-heme iron oxygenase ferredoxin subunit [archaeon]
MPFVRVAAVNEIKPGEGKVLDASGREIALFNIDGNFHAIDNICPHRGGPLGEGMLDGCVVACPLHGWRFNVETGSSVMPPGLKQMCFAVKIEGNDILVEV